MPEPLTCFYNRANEVSRKERAQKSLRSFRSPFAEADPEIQPKNLRRSRRGRRKQHRLQALLAEASRKGFAEGVVSVVK